MPEEFILALSVLKMDYDLIYKQSIHAQENEDVLNVVTQMFLESFDVLPKAERTDTVKLDTSCCHCFKIESTDARLSELRWSGVANLLLL